MLLSDCMFSHSSAMPTTLNCLHLNGHTEEISPWLFDISAGWLFITCSLGKADYLNSNFFDPCWRSMFFLLLVLSHSASKTLESCWIAPQKLPDWAALQVWFIPSFIRHSPALVIVNCITENDSLFALTLPAMWPFTEIIHSETKFGSKHERLSCLYERQKEVFWKMPTLLTNVIRV